jgi:uncharacterized membrane protein
VTAVIGGLGAAIVWAIGSVGASRAARGLGPFLTLAWVMLVGLVLMAFLVPASGSVSLKLIAVVWLVLGGVGNVGGLLVMYRALRLGRLGVVLPIVTTEGGIAALIAILAGQSVGAARGGALLVTMLGVLLAASSSRKVTPLPATASPIPAGSAQAVADPTGHSDRRAAAWAALGALSFGVGLYAAARASAVLPIAWAVLPPRAVGVLGVTLPLALRGRLTVPRGYIRWVLLSGVCEVGGYFSYTFGARHGIAIAAVLATLTGMFGAAIGRLVFHERLTSKQLVGVAVIFIGVAAVSALSA